MISFKSLLAALSLAALASAADVPTSILRHSVNTSVTNRDVLTLAKAGFDEEFIIRTLLGARCSCDTTADALAALAEQGISQRVIEVMLDASYSAPSSGMVIPSVETAPVNSFIRTASMENSQVLLSTPGMQRAVPQYAIRPSLAAMAIASRVPYYEEHSSFLGLFRSKTAVGGLKAPDGPSMMVPMQVNDSWQHVGMPVMYPALPRSSTGRTWHTAAFGMGGVLVVR